jgi:hypothetical protein
MQNPVMCLNATQTKSDSDSLAGLRLAETDCDRVSKYLNLLEKSKWLDEAVSPTNYLLFVLSSMISESR